MAYLGIDVAEVKPQYLAILVPNDRRLRVDRVVTESARVAFSAGDRGIAALLGFIAEQYPGSPISIDAPRRPLGKCNPGTRCGRECERELQRGGVRIFYTPCADRFHTPGFECPNGRSRPGWMEVGFRIYAGVHADDVIEVYPHATFYYMLRAIAPDARVYPKSGDMDKLGRSAVRAAGIEQRRRLLAAYGVDLGSYAQTRSFDELDAIAAAFTTYCHATGQSECVGDEDEGQIVIPALRPPDGSQFVNPLPEGTGVPPASPIVRQRGPVNDQINVRLSGGSEIERPPTDDERKAIHECTILKHPGQACVVYCVDCGEPRVVNPQDFPQVKRCARCQAGHARMRRRAARLPRRE